MEWHRIEGWFSGLDAQFVRSICKSIHDGVVVELGFYAGKSTAIMASICKINNNTYHAVDNCAGTDPRDPATQAQQSRDMRQVFEDNMRSLRIWDYLNVHVMDSTASATMFDDESVDFCFVDASHKAEDVERDIEAWWPKIKSGGVLAGHDWMWKSVRGVVKAFAECHQLNFVAEDNCWKIVK